MTDGTQKLDNLINTYHELEELFKAFNTTANVIGAPTDPLQRIQIMEALVGKMGSMFNIATALAAEFAYLHDRLDQRVQYIEADYNQPDDEEKMLRAEENTLPN